MRNTLNVMRHRILLTIYLILVWESSLLAQNHYNFSQFTHETGDFLLQPTKWRGNDWLKLGLITTGTVLMMQVDQPIRKIVLNGDRKYYYSVPIEAGRIWGEWYMPPVVVGGFALHGWLAHNASSRKVSFEILQAVIYSESITGGLKFVFGRARPFQNQGAFSFHPFSFRNFGFQSLPGGHNTEGWAMSTVLSRNAHSDVLKILAYTPAALTFVSRIYQDQHWTSDDFLGAVIGYIVGDWVVDTHEKKESAVSVTAIYPLTVSIRF
jgi:membrane-associated phospholipid phosphatase